jgi:membrane protein YdbS with pleckstrin-like domain
MGEQADSGAQARKAERRWAVVRLILGQAQMVGAIISACLLFWTGLNAFSLASVFLTTACTMLSLFLFRGSSVQG